MAKRIAGSTGTDEIDVIPAEVTFNPLGVTKGEQFIIRETFKSFDATEHEFEETSKVIFIRLASSGNMVVDYDEAEKYVWVKAEDFGKLQLLVGDKSWVKEKEEEEENDPPHDGWGTFNRLTHLTPSVATEWFFAVIFGFLNGCCMPGFAVGFKYAVDWLAEIEQGTDDMPKEAFWILGLFVSIGLLTGLFTFLQVAFFHRMGTKIACEMRRQFYASMLAQDQTFHDRTSSSKLNAQLATKTDAIGNGLGTQLGLTVQHLGELCGGIGYAMYVSWEITLVLLGLTPVLMFTGWIQGKIASSTTGSGSDEFSDTLASSGETLGGIKTVNSLNAQNHHYTKYADKLSVVEAAKRATGLKNGFGMGLFLFGLFGCIYSGGLFYGAFRVDAGKVSSGDVFGAFFGVLIGGMGMGQVGASLPDVIKGVASASVCFRVIDRVPQMKVPSNGDGKDSGIQGQIEFVDLKFAYPTRPDVLVYERLNLTIGLGQTVAFVGPSGCGKSTIVNLLERFYDPLGGQILIDGVEIHEYNLEYLRSQISLVSQEPVLFDLTVEENIRLGVMHEVPQSEVVQASKQSNAHGFIEDFPEKYNTPVGEKGSQMSGGQKQRIAIARGVLKQPKIILLDEATSALDTESEQVVQAALDKLINQEQCTCIVIAHRLSTIKGADVIVVLEHGRIVEMGNHDDLILMDGKYAEMIDAQNVLEEQEPGIPLAMLKKHSFSMSTSKEI